MNIIKRLKARKGDIVLKMTRLVSDSNSTLGALQTLVGTFATCEDEFRLDKVPGETRIPAGTYRVELRPASTSGMGKRYMEKFGDWHKGMMEITGIKGFTDVYLHIGNDEGDSRGCPLVAFRANYDCMTIGRSTEAYMLLAQWLIPMLTDGFRVFIEIEDGDQ